MERLSDLLIAIDAYCKATRIKKKLDIFKDSDSPADRNMRGKLHEMELLIDELLDTEPSLSDVAELSTQICEVHLTYRKFTTEVLQATPVTTPDVDGSRPRSNKPIYGDPKTEMPTFEDDPKLWRKFGKFFNQCLSMHPDLPASAPLKQAIKPPDGCTLISAPKGTEKEYMACVHNLEEQYNQPRWIYQTYVQETFEHSTPHTRRGLYTPYTKL